MKTSFIVFLSSLFLTAVAVGLLGYSFYLYDWDPMQVPTPLEVEQGAELDYRYWIAVTGWWLGIVAANATGISGTVALVWRYVHKWRTNSSAKPKDGSS